MAPRTVRLEEVPCRFAHSPPLRLPVGSHWQWRLWPAARRAPTAARTTAVRSPKGSGSDTELYDDTVTVTLKGADGTTAELEVDGESLSCREGDTATVGEVDVTCATVGDDEVKLEVVR